MTPSDSHHKEETSQYHERANPNSDEHVERWKRGYLLGKCEVLQNRP